MTLLDTLIQVLQRAADFNRFDQVAPAAILIPDAERDWESIVPLLRAELSVLTLSDYKPEELSGPAVWLRCAHARVLDKAQLADGIPIIYLPNIGSQDLRAVTQYQRIRQPLADLYFRSAMWVQTDGHDWTIPAFLETIGVPTREDAATRKSLRRVLPRLAEIELTDLCDGAPWKAADLEALLGFRPGPTLRDLILQGESETLEFKSTARWDVNAGVQKPERERDIYKAVAAFLNSSLGGTLLIGVSDDGEVRGLEDDYRVFKPEDRDRDGFEQWLARMLLNELGNDMILNFRIQIHNYKGKDVC